MAKRCWLSLSLAALMTASTTAQDPRNVLQATATAMGVNNMRSIHYAWTLHGNPGPMTQLVQLVNRTQ
jgi:hypothetical protein